jgi:hypothetical protein
MRIVHERVVVVGKRVEEEVLAHFTPLTIPTCCHLFYESSL